MNDDENTIELSEETIEMLICLFGIYTLDGIISHAQIIKALNMPKSSKILSTASKIVDKYSCVMDGIRARRDGPPA